MNDLAEYLEEKATYSRVVDEAGEPTKEIDEKETYHVLDAERYIVGYIKTPVAAATSRPRQIAGSGIGSGAMYGR